MTRFGDPALVAKQTIELLGGRDAAFETIMAEFGKMQHRWKQDVEAIGRILRSHLYVEHYMTEYLEKANPRLGSVERSRLSFVQKLELLDPKDIRISEVLPGIRHLNTIRNRLAHQLSTTVTEDDAAVFLSARYFKALRDEGAKPGKPSAEPIEVLEHFAIHASQILTGEFSSLANAFAQAINEFNSPVTT